MRLDVSAKAIQDAVSAVCRFVPGKSISEYWKLINISSDGQGTLTVRAGSADVAVSHIVHEAHGSAGEVCVNAQRLREMLACFAPEAHLMMSVGDNTLTLTCEKARYALAALGPDAWPGFAAMEDPECELVLDAPALRRLFDATWRACSGDTTRPALTGVRLTISDAGIKAEATDTHTLAQAMIPRAELEECSTVSDGTLGIIAPVHVVRELLSMLGQYDGQMAVLIRGGVVEFRTDTWTVHSNTIDGQFPKTERLYRGLEDFDRRFTVDRDALADAVRMVAVVAERDRTEHYGRARLDFVDSDQLRLSTGSAEAEAEFVVSIEKSTVPQGYFFYVSTLYLRRALQSLDEDQVTFWMKSRMERFYIRGEVSDRVNGIVMPMHPPDDEVDEVAE